MEAKLELPKIKSRCKFSPDELSYHLSRNLALGIEDLYALYNEYHGSLAIINGGPSVDKHWDEIALLTMPIMAISRMVPALVKHERFPNFVVSMDSSPDQKAGFNFRHQDAKYIMSTVANSDIVDKLCKGGYKVYLFDSYTDEDLHRRRQEAGYQVDTVIQASGSISVAALGVAMFLGFRDLHVFGFDCMIEKADHHHSRWIAGKSHPEQMFELPLGGKTYLTSPPYLEFAQEAGALIEAGKANGLLDNITFYGDTLVGRV